MRKGNNGVIRQAGWIVAELGDWHYQKGGLRAELVAPFQNPDKADAPMRVTLYNGDQAEVDGDYYVSGIVCPNEQVLRAILFTRTQGR